MRRLTTCLCLGIAIAALASGATASASPPTPSTERTIMTGPNASDTPREAEVRSIIGDVSTAQGGALSSARGAIERMGAKADALKQATIDDETNTEFHELASGLVTDAQNAAAEFDKIGVVSPGPVEPVPTPQSRRKGKR